MMPELALRLEKSGWSFRQTCGADRQSEGKAFRKCSPRATENTPS